MMEIEQARKRRYILRKWILPDIPIMLLAGTWLLFDLKSRGVIVLTPTLLLVSLLLPVVLTIPIAWLAGEYFWKRQIDTDE